MASANSPDPCEIISASVVELAVAVCLRLARDEGEKQLDHSRHRNALRYTHTHILEKLAALCQRKAQRRTYDRPNAKAKARFASSPVPSP